MNFKQVQKFAKRANYNRQIGIFVGYIILKGISPQKYKEFKNNNELDENGCCAIPIYDEEELKLITSIIIIGKKYWEQYKNDELIIKETILHEIGHTKTIKKDINRFENMNSMGKWEMDSQIWAIKRANNMGLIKIKRKLISDFMEWKNYPEPYNIAYKLYKKMNHENKNF